ncbi:helix-turn-helix transcriptional regulator [Nocardioides kribbensis]|uniref:Helix-turn-helix transcriptional regulator n=1 Tax=Nocardioides kribbensis TaxID=305517 RepID=A0ABV1NZ25_9ACTN
MQVKDPATVKRWRKHRRLTQRELAFLCRCSQNAISLVENGGMSTLSEDLALEIAYRLDVPWEDLFVAREHSGVRRAAHGAHATRTLPEAVGM